MLWHKAWLETRWRFLIGLAVLMFSAASSVMVYPQLAELLPLAEVELGGELGRQVRQNVELARSYRGYVWSQWFVQNLPQLWTLFAVLLGTGSLLAQGSGRGALFTLSLPVSRDRLLTVRAVTGLTELLALAILPSLLVPLLSPAIGEAYSARDALVHGACLFIGGSVFFSLAFLLSTVFSDVWRPMLIALCVAIGLGVLHQVSRDLSAFDVFRVMSAEVYFRKGGLPWLGLLVSATASVAMLYAAVVNIARRDF